MVFKIRSSTSASYLGYKLYQFYQQTEVKLKALPGRTFSGYVPVMAEAFHKE